MPALRFGRLVLLALGALGFAPVGVGIARSNEPRQSAVSFVLENDVFSNTDQHYTPTAFSSRAKLVWTRCRYGC